MKDINKLEERIKFKIAISKIDDEEKDITMNKKKILINKKIGLVACAFLIFTTGVFAKDIENYIKKIFNNSTEAINSAVENGYVQNEDMDYVYDKDIGIKVDNLVLDNLNLDISFNFETKKGNVKSIRFDTFNIKTESGKIVYNSEFEYVENPDELPIYNSLTWNNAPEKISNTNFSDSILLGLRQNSEDFNKLYFEIESLNLVYEDETVEKVSGFWSFNITIDEKMKKSTTIKYSIEKENEYVESCTGILSATGMIIELNLTDPLDPMRYIQENSEKIDNIGLFYLRNGTELIEPSRLEIQNATHTKYILHYDKIGIFYDNIDKIEMYLEPFNVYIVLNKEKNK